MTVLTRKQLMDMIQEEIIREFQMDKSILERVAEKEGFEPSIGLLL